MTEVLKNYYQTRKTIEGFVGVDPAGIIMDMIGCANCGNVGQSLFGCDLLCGLCHGTDEGSLICCYECRTIFSHFRNWEFCDGCHEEFCEQCCNKFQVSSCQECEECFCSRCADHKYVIAGDDYCVDCVKATPLK